MLLKIALGLVGLGVVVFFHELGHYLAARIVGIHVEAFSIGFGRPLLRFSRKDTVYQLGWIPFGGFCRLKGEHALQEALAKGLSEIPKEPHSFFAAPPLARIFVSLAGPLGNLIFAILVVGMLWTVGFPVRSPGTTIVLESDYPLVTAEGYAYPATEAGLRTGDTILAVNGSRIRTFSELSELILLEGNEPLLVEVDRNGTRLTFTVTPAINPETGLPRIGVYAWIDPVVERVQEGSSAAIAGIRPGDRILAVDGVPVPHTIALHTYLSTHSPRKVALSVMRGDAPISVDLIPHYENGAPVLGIQFVVPVVTLKAPPLEALVRSWNQITLVVRETLRGLVDMVRGRTAGEVMGPLRISYAVGDVITQGVSSGGAAGIVPAVQFLAFISIALAVFNLLPLPVLDGGHILIYSIEFLSRRALPPRVLYRYQMIGGMIIMALAVVILFMDIFSLTGWH